MPAALPRLRMDLDFMPSPVPDRPGLLIRDPFHYSEATLIVPPALVECLQLFDGTQTELDLRGVLVRLTGDLNVGEVVRHLRETLSEAGFCDDETYAEMRDRRHAIFAQAEWRAAAHAGAAYSADAEELRGVLKTKLDGGMPRPGLVGIAAPHISPEGGWGCYRAAYGALDQANRERTFVVLGTSHYGEPDRFGLTRKSFVTPLGAATTAVDLVDELVAAGGPAVKLEDYAHAVEHSIEFQVLFLQHVYGPGVRILPILCGTFLRCAHDGGRPEGDRDLQTFLAALRALGERRGEDLFWVLGIDMAHMGRRYGDSFSARAGSGEMERVAVLDRERIDRIAAGDSAGFWSATRGFKDELKWCGTTPLYTFLQAVPGARAELLNYEQWNIDEHSVVSFGALAFRR